MSTTPADAKNENLQILRFFAAALVLLTHITFYVHERIAPGVAIWHNGEVGVPIFFVISGFVMQFTSPRFPKNADGAGDFLRRRIARLFPLYWVITSAKIVLALVIPAAVLHNHPTLPAAVTSFLLFPSYNAAGEIRPIHGVAWTLLHEMFFYYVFALALACRRSPLVFCTVVISGFWIAGRIVYPDSAPLRVCVDQMNLMFVAGMLLARLHAGGFQLPKPLAYAFLIFSAWAVLSQDFLEFKRAYLHSFFIDAVLLVFSLLNVHFTHFPVLRKQLRDLGDASYSLYLIHPIVAAAICVALYRVGVISVPVLIAVAAIVAIVCSTFVFRFVEAPASAAFRRLLDVRFGRRAGVI